jgi:transposase
MVVEKIDVFETLDKAKELLKKENNLSPALKAIIEVMMLLITILTNRLGLNSSNSSIPPSKDSNRKRKAKKTRANKTKRIPGGQTGHAGSTLEKVDNPHEIEEIDIDRRTLPPGNYKSAGYEGRQVFDINVSLHIKEYRAEVLEDESGNRYVASFPDEVTKAVQYGVGIKAESVYMSQFQLVPLDRVKDHFDNQIGLPMSKGSISNFNKAAFEKLSYFESWAKVQLLNSKINHADETGINVNGKKIWLHCLSNDKVTFYHPDEKRGTVAMDNMGVLPNYKGILCHDHWKPYYQYGCVHSLCNAHHLRELERAYEQDGQKWAKLMQDLLLKMNEAVDKTADGVLPKNKVTDFKNRYRKILKEGESECPAPKEKTGKRGRPKKSKSRNLLERLQNFEADTLRFLTTRNVPFTNNRGESDLRMTKVQQKISGCFRTMGGAEIFCRVRGFLSTCRKHDVNPSDVLKLLFKGKLPSFIT